jgi:hypothetical protein
MFTLKFEIYAENGIFEEILENACFNRRQHKTNGMIRMKSSKEFQNQEPVVEKSLFLFVGLQLFHPQNHPSDKRLSAEMTKIGHSASSLLPVSRSFCFHNHFSGLTL